MNSLIKKSTFRNIILLNILYIKNLFPAVQGYILNDEIIFKVPSSKIDNFLFFLKMHSYTQYKMLVEICGVDYPEKKDRFEVVYNLLSLVFNTRITITVMVDELTPVPTVTHIYSSAGWLEREIWDMFGIFFLGNKDLRRILTDYGFKGHPLRKDFPLTGFTEVRYDDFNKKIAYEEVSLSQDYRIFLFDNSFYAN